MEKSQAAKLVASLMAAFPQSQVSAATSVAYEQDLLDLDFDATRDACTILRRECEFLPTIARIRNAVADLQHGPRRTGAEAWQDVEREQRRAGYMRRPRFDDAVVASIVAADWPTWCKPDNPAADRARFIELYEVRSKRARADLVSGIPLPPAKAPERLPERVSGRQALGIVRALPSATASKSGAGRAQTEGGPRTVGELMVECGLGRLVRR